MMLAASHAGLLEWSLNALWLLLTLAAACAAYRHRTSRSNLPQLATALVALACAATVLFPTISVSDDLHSQQWAIEDNRIIAKKHEHPTEAVQSPEPLAMGTFLPKAAPPACPTTRILPADEVATPQRFVPSTADRAPPSIGLVRVLRRATEFH